MDKSHYLWHKTRIVGGDVPSFFRDLKLSILLPLKDWRDEDYPSSLDDPDNRVPRGTTWYGIHTNTAARKSARSRSLRSFMYVDLQGFEGLMKFFWLNHFGVDYNTILDPDIYADYYLLIRKHCIGNFKDFLGEMTINPAMLMRLNGDSNRKSSPNANYARELYELFSLGRDNGYTEFDITETARALTGWEVHDKKAVFAAQNWDDGTKTIFGYTISLGVGAVIDVLFQERAREISQHIATKLVRYFTGGVNEILISDVAFILRESQWNIQTALIELFTHDLFYDDMAGIVKSPLELIHSLPLPCNNDINYYHVYSNILLRCEEMGLDIMNPPEIAGNKPYHLAPDYDLLWFNNSSSIMRANIIDELFDPWKFTLDSKYMFYIDVMNSFVLREDPNIQVREALKYLSDEWTDDEIQQLKLSTLLSGQPEDRYWTNAVYKLNENPSNSERISVIRTRLESLYRAIFQNQQFQVK